MWTAGFVSVRRQCGILREGVFLTTCCCWCCWRCPAGALCVQADALPGVAVDLTAEAADDLLQQGPGQAAGREPYVKEGVRAGAAGLVGCWCLVSDDGACVAL